MAFRLKANVWSMKYFFLQVAVELQPPCHMCGQPVSYLNQNLLYYCEWLDTFREEFPYLSQTYTHIDQVLGSPTHQDVLQLLHLSKYIERQPARKQETSMLDTVNNIQEEDELEEDINGMSHALSIEYTDHRRSHIFHSQIEF